MNPIVKQILLYAIFLGCLYAFKHLSIGDMNNNVIVVGFGCIVLPELIKRPLQSLAASFKT
ncbi:hypothetical protein AEAC466_19060 [Asticcacaulis sp. AC466]|uniref:hypothetical protein n=1 Tax=Asticcacaulis sp. AC466 TaxID=1282362 RepID=UPI0003C40D50|nr:hypothetical protein [Asticcacaulis sp. AC466]ESQ82019.1 hypothetical protein AEAC466_19060 [Asticcacaulis sp. AC466]